MICTCDKCLYTFRDFTRPETCPDCGSGKVREATPEEKSWYLDLQEEKKYNPLLLDRVS
jgi:ABC-type ATPase with predicted acetyltransferase domain